MNDDLLISIGADLSSFEQTLKTAKSKFEAHRKNINNLSKTTSVIQSVADFTKQLNLNEKKYAAFVKKIKKLNKNATDSQIKEAFRLHKAQLTEQEEARAKAYRIRARANKVRLRNARLLKEKEIKLEKEKLDKITQLQLAQARREYSIRQKQLKQEAVSSRATTVSGRTTLTDSAISRNLLDSVAVVARYGAISQVLYGIQTSIGSIIAEIGRFSDSQKQLQAVLGADIDESLSAANKIVELGIRYGTGFADIQEGMITLGRAGVEEMKTLEQATEGLAALSILTGDSMGDGAAAMASMISVYPELIHNMKSYTETLDGLEVRHVGYIDKLGAIANATRLGLKDFSTINNYALTTATSIGLTADAYLQLQGAMSKVGLNASTIGTSIRRLSKFTQDSSNAVKRFYAVIGKSQKQFAKDLRNDATQELLNFTTRLKEMNDAQFSNAIKDLNIQMKATAVTMREIGKGNWLAEMIYQTETAKDVLAQADIAAEGLGITWQRIANAVKSAGDLAFASVLLEIEKVIKAIGITSPEAFDALGESIASFAEFAIRAIANITAALATMINMIKLGVSGLAKLGGVVIQKSGEIYGGVSSEDNIANLKEVAKLEKQIAEYKAGDDVEDDLNARNKLKNLKAEVEQYQDAAGFAQGLVTMGEDMRGFGDDAMTNVALTQEGIDKLWKSAYQGLEDYRATRKKATDEAKEQAKKLREADTSSYTEGGNVPKAVAEELRAIEKVNVLRDIMNKKITYQEGQLRLITGEINAQADKYSEMQKLADADVFSSKARLDAKKAEEALLTLMFRKQQMMRKEAESGNAKSSKAATEASRMAKYRMQIDKEIAKQKVIQEKIDLKLGKGQISLMSNRLKTAMKLKKEATELVKKNKENVIDDRTRLELKKSETKELEAQLKLLEAMTNEINKWSSVFDNLLSGDIGNAIGTLFKDSFAALQLNIAETVGDSIGGSLGSTLGTALGGLTGAAIGLGLDLMNDLLSSTPSEAQTRFDTGLSASEFTDESIANMIDAFESAQYPLLEATNEMSKYLRSMDNNFYDIARAIGGVNSTSGIDITGSGVIEGIYDGGVLSSKSLELLGAGLIFAEQTLGDMIDVADLIIQGYETTQTTKSYLWKTVVKNYVDKFDLPPEVVEQFADSFASGYETLMTAGVLLGMNEANLQSALEQATITLGDAEGKIDLSGLDDAGIADALNNIFGDAFSQVVDQIGDFDNLVERYAKGTEDSLETLLRIAYEYEQASVSFAMIGRIFTDSVLYTTTGVLANAFINVTETILGGATSITTAMSALTSRFVTTYTAQEKLLDIVDASGGMDAFNDNMSAFMQGFYSEVEQMAMLEQSLSTQFSTLAADNAQLVDGLPETNEGFRDLLEGFEILNEQDAETYAGLLSLSSGFAELNPMLEELETILTTLTDAVLYTQYIGSSTDFASRELALTGDDTAQAEYAVTASKMMLDAITAQTELYGITMDNYEDQFAAAHLAGELTADQLSNWETMGDALLNVAEAQKSYNDLLGEAVEEIDLSAIQSAIKAVSDAWLGNLSYLTLAQKAEYASGYLSIAQDSDGQIDTVAAAKAAAETALKNSATREEYIPAFEQYIDVLQEQIPEATTDDVVAKLDELITAVKNMDDNNTRIAG